MKELASSLASGDETTILRSLEEYMLPAWNAMALTVQTVDVLIQEIARASEDPF